MSKQSNYDLSPVVHLTEDEAECLDTWRAIFAYVRAQISEGATYSIALECYPGIAIEPLCELLRQEFAAAAIINVEAAYKSSEELHAMLRESLTEDPVFAVMRPWTIAEYFDAERLDELRVLLRANTSLTIAVGTGAAHALVQPDLILHAGVTRWELQKRQRQGLVGNLGIANQGDAPALLYKQAFFVDWRLADDLRHGLYAEIDAFLDLDDQDQPRMVSGPVLRRGLATCAHRPFRVEPFFDPGPWGGHWMKERFNLPDGPRNYAWCFDCVPEENALVLGFGAKRFRLPSLLLVHEHPRALLGDTIYRHFGAEFPIRFDLLDTVGGGNLSLQVHPLTRYIQKNFGMTYTQDESYYILDATAGAELFLGLRTGIDKEAMRRDLEAAQRRESNFPAESYINILSTHRHDHFAIPAGTVHCSGAGNLVLEISATPYIFTFKLWDWGRLGLDSQPRPIHLDRGIANIQWDRNTGWVEQQLLHQVQDIAQGDGWREEHTGLHSSQFIETRRTWFTKPVLHHTEGTLHVLNLVEGEAVLVESPEGAFAPFEVHYAETFIVPAAVGAYLVRPSAPTDRPFATIKAFVRRDADLSFLQQSRSDGADDQQT